MTDYLTWNYSGMVSKEKKKRLSIRAKVKQLEEKVGKLTIENEKLHSKIITQTRVSGGRYFGINCGKPLYAADAIGLIMNHLDMRFEHSHEHYTVSPKPPPVEDDEEYDDD